MPINQSNRQSLGSLQSSGSATPQPGAVLVSDKLDSIGLTILLSGVFLAVMSTFVVNVAIPSIQHEFGATTAEVSAVVAYYGLAYGIMLVTGARLGDLYGRRRMFVLGLAAFTVSALVCGIAPSISVLIGARISEGIGAAIMFPQVLSTIRVTATDDKERARMFAAFGVALGLSGIFGPLVGGALIAADLGGMGWRTVFLFNVPIGALACFGGLRLLPETRSEQAQRLDVTGAILGATGLGLLLYPLIEGRHAGWAGWTFVSMIAAMAVLAVFLLDQIRKARLLRSPLIEPSLFKSPSFASGMAIAFLFHSTIVAFLFALALFLQVSLGYSPWHAALITAPIPVAFLLTSLMASRILPSYGTLPLMILGGVAAAAGYAGCAAIALNQGVADGWGLVPALLALGFGQGLFLPPMLNAVLASTSKSQAGLAAGLVATAQQVGGSFGVAIAGLLYFGALPASDAADLPGHVHAFFLGVTYEIGAAMLAVLLLPILFRRSPHP